MHNRSYLALLFAVVVGLSSCATSKKALTRKRKIDEVVSTARTFTGTPYKWGGNTSKGIDCSGLICQSYNSIQQPLPRTSKDQCKFGKKVKVRKLRSGDLLFFAMSKRRRKITHVGMVTDVERDKIMFIHASSKIGVVERDLMKEYYMKRLRRARRVIQ